MIVQDGNRLQKKNKRNFSPNGIEKKTDIIRKKIGKARRFGRMILLKRFMMGS